MNRGGLVSDRVDTVIRWLPAAGGVVFATILAVKLPSLVNAAFYDSDVATAPVLGEALADGLGRGATVVIAHYPYTTTLWWEQLTHPLPYHRYVWEAFGTLLQIGSVAILGAISWRLAGRWAGATTAALALAVSPFVSRGLVTPNFRTTTWFTVVVIGAIVVIVELARTVRPELAFPALVAVAVFVGANLASDNLLAAAGLVPLALTGLTLLAVRRRLWGDGTVLLGIAAIALIAMKVTESIAHASGIRVVEEPVGLVALRDVPGNLDRFVHLFWLQGNGDFSSRPFGLRWLLAVACAALASAGGLIVVALAVRAVLRGCLSAVDTYVVYWGFVLLVLSGAFVFTTGGQRLGWYLIVLVYAAPAVLPIAACSATPDRIATVQTVLAAAVTFVIAVNIVALARNEFRFGGVGPVERAEPRIARIAAAEGVSIGYADYWSASNLTWGSKLKLHVRPVRTCGVESRTGLCPMEINYVSSWYEPKSNVKSMLIADLSSPTFPGAPSPGFGTPSRIYSVGTFKLYIYAYDIARAIG